MVVTELATGVNERPIQAVLVVEDDTGVNSLVRRALGRSGFETLEALDRQTAIQAVRSSPDVLMLVDYKLPDMLGSDLVRELDRLGLKKPFIAMTGHGDESVAVKMMKLGALDYLVKGTGFIEHVPEVVKRVSRELETSRRLQSVENELRESEAKFRRLVELSPGVVYVHSSGLGGIYYSPRVTELLGYKIDQLLEHGFLWRDCIHPEDAEVVMEAWRAVQRGESYNIEYRIRAASGDWRWLHDQSMGIRRVDGDFLVEGLALDITERRRSEELLRRSEERFRVLLERAPEAVIVHDIETEKVVEANPKAEKLFGCSREDLIENGVTRFYMDFQPDGRACAESIFNHRVLALAGEEVVFERVIRNALGKKRVCEVRLAGLPSLDKHLIRASWIDVTQRKRAEKELRMSMERFQGLFLHAPIGMMLLDEISIIIDVNSAAEHVLSVQKSTCIGKSFLEMLSDEAVTRFVKEGLGTGQCHFQGLSASTLNGKELFLKSSIMIIQKNLFLLFVEDITEQERLKELMVQNEKMMSVGGLAAGMAHEINNPLSGILQSLQVITNRLESDIPANIEAARASGCSMESIREYINRRSIKPMLDIVGETARRAAQIVRNMLDFSRKNDSTIAQVNVNNLLDKSIELFGTDYDIKKKYDFRNINVERDYETTLPQITGSASKIEQVFINILHNAVQAMVDRPDGEAQRKIILRTRKENSFVRIEIEDNGPGMGEDIRHKIFEPFFTTKPVGVGTGLGLSVAYFIITNNHGGTIEVESQPGKGTRFTIRLPYTQGDRNSEE
jgi:PAS domain S-box-containing protein